MTAYQPNFTERQLMLDLDSGLMHDLTTAKGNMMQKYAKQRGFSLIELMVTVAIIGIITAVALPSYSQYLARGKVADATSTLSDLRIKMEQYFQDNRTYVGALCAPAQPSKYFNFACSVQTATTYTLAATGKAEMAGFNYTVNQDNLKTSDYGGGGSGNCWLTSKTSTC